MKRKVSNGPKSTAMRISPSAGRKREEKINNPFD